MSPVLWKEWRQSRQLLAGALIAIVAMPLLLAASMFRYFHHASNGADPLWAPGATVVPLILTTPLLAVILAARIFCRDFGADTETFLLSKPVRTSTVVAAKFAAGFGVLAAVIVVSLGLETLLAAFTGTLDQMEEFPREFRETAAVELPLVVAIFAATAAAAVWLRRTTSAALVGLFFVALWCTLPLIVRGSWSFSFLTASALAGYSGSSMTVRLVAGVWLLGLAVLAAVLCVVLARWPARRQVRPKHLAIAAAVVVLSVFVGLTRQVGNNLRIVESMSTPPGTFEKTWDRTVAGPNNVGGRFVCFTTESFLHCFEWDPAEGLTAHRKLQINRVFDGTHVRVLSMTPGDGDDVWLVRERYARHEHESGSTFDGIDLIRVDLGDSVELEAGPPLVLGRQQEGRPAYVGVPLVVKGRYGYLLWVESHTVHRRGGPPLLRVLDLTQRGEAAVVHQQTVPLSRVYTSGWPRPTIELHGDLLVVTPQSPQTANDWQKGFVAFFDIAGDPSRPRRLSALPSLPSRELEIARNFERTTVSYDGQLLCLANTEGLWVYRLSGDGRTWELLGQRHASLLEMVLSGETPRLQRVGDRLYASTKDFGLIVHDLSDPTRPRRIAHWNGSGDNLPHVASVGSHIIIPSDWPGQGPRLLVAERP